VVWDVNYLHIFAQIFANFSNIPAIGTQPNTSVNNYRPRQNSNGVGPEHQFYETDWFCVCSLTHSGDVSCRMSAQPMAILSELRIASHGLPVLILWRHFETGNGRVTPHSRQLTHYVRSPILSDVQSISHTCEWQDVTLHLDNNAICLCPFQFAVHDYSAVSFEVASAIDVKSLNNTRTDYPKYTPPPSFTQL